MCPRFKTRCLESRQFIAPPVRSQTLTQSTATAPLLSAAPIVPRRSSLSSLSPPPPPPLSLRRRCPTHLLPSFSGEPPSRSGVSVPLTSPAAANVSAVAVGGDGNGAAGGPVGSGVEVARARRMLQVVLVSPLIPGNTGSIARTCAASAVGLHLVGPLGYKVDDTKLKCAGLDYWPYVVVKIHDSWDHFCDYFMKQEGDKRLLAFTKRGTQIHSDFSYRPGDWLVFGSETKGSPQQALEDCCKEGLGGGTVRIPMVET